MPSYTILTAIISAYSIIHDALISWNEFIDEENTMLFNFCMRLVEIKASMPRWHMMHRLRKMPEITAVHDIVK